MAQLLGDHKIEVEDMNEAKAVLREAVDRGTIHDFNKVRFIGVDGAFLMTVTHTNEFGAIGKDRNGKVVTVGKS